MTTIEEKRKKIEELEKIALGGNNQTSVNQFVPELKPIDIGATSLLNENKSAGPGFLGAIDRKFGNILQDSGFLSSTEERVAENAITSAQYLDQPAYIIDNSTGQLIPNGVTKLAPKVAEFSNKKDENGQNLYTIFNEADYQKFAPNFEAINNQRPELSTNEKIRMAKQNLAGAMTPQRQVDVYAQALEVNEAGGPKERNLSFFFPSRDNEGNIKPAENLSPIGVQENWTLKNIFRGDDQIFGSGYEETTVGTSGAKPEIDVGLPTAYANWRGKSIFKDFLPDWGSDLEGINWADTVFNPLKGLSSVETSNRGGKFALEISSTQYPHKTDTVERGVAKAKVILPILQAKLKSFREDIEAQEKFGTRTSGSKDATDLSRQQREYMENVSTAIMAAEYIIALDREDNARTKRKVINQDDFRKRMESITKIMLPNE
jgi:hypothetical protein